jgi:anthranilate/para-aminobenzoate synthase component II
VIRCARCRLVQYLGEMRVEMQVHRNDRISLEQIRALNPDRLLISPGPCSPRESGLSNEIIRTFGAKVPTLGVCLGHQCIGQVFGAEVVRSPLRLTVRVLRSIMTVRPSTAACPALSRADAIIH